MKVGRGLHGWLHQLIISHLTSYYCNTFSISLLTLQVYLESATLEETTSFFTTSLNKFLTAELQFQVLEESAAVSALAKVGRHSILLFPILSCTG